MNLPAVWALRVLWLLAPFTTGDLLGSALDGRSDAVRTTGLAVAWVVWAIGLLATAVPLPLTLVVVRTAMPLATAASVWASLEQSNPGGRAIASLLLSTVTALVVLSPPVGDAFIDGASYGRERRMPLRTPGALLLGPVQLAWAVLVTTLVAGPLLLAAGSWPGGIAVLAVGLPLSWLSARALHGLSRRMLVFVPGGLLVHDPLSLADPVLFARHNLRRLGPAPADSTALDLTRGALGLALEMSVAEAVLLTRIVGRGESEAVTSHAVLISPTRPGKVLVEARARRLVQ